MHDLDLDSLREILTPLDLTLHFAVIGGDHLIGLAAPDSEMRVREGHLKAHTASLGGGRRGRGWNSSWWTARSPSTSSPTT